mgnify:FL=1|tara:strand:+ start:478 stop:708 length:231 start_codon:yes stop_codon:yes gene_type:complete
MTTEFQNELKAYATEDVQLALDNGCINICDTKSGLITIDSITATTLQAKNNRNELLTGIMTESRMVQWLSNQYTIA